MATFTASPIVSPFPDADQSYPVQRRNALLGDVTEQDLADRATLRAQAPGFASNDPTEVARARGVALSIPVGVASSAGLSGAHTDQRAGLDHALSVSAGLAQAILLAPAEQREGLWAQFQPIMKQAGAIHAPDRYPGDATAAAVRDAGFSAEKRLEWMSKIPYYSTSGAPLDPMNSRGPGGAGGAAAAGGGPAGGGGQASATVPPAYMPFYQEASARTGIPVNVLVAQGAQESQFNANAIGGAGEIGLHQILPSTARQPGFGMAGVDPASLRDPRTNINFAADYLKARGGPRTDFSNPATVDAALRNYNGGGDPNYVANVRRRMGGGGAVAAGAPAPASTPTPAPGVPVSFGAVAPRTAVPVGNPGAPPLTTVASPASAQVAGADGGPTLNVAPRLGDTAHGRYPAAMMATPEGRAAAANAAASDRASAASAAATYGPLRQGPVQVAGPGAPTSSSGPAPGFDETNQPLPAGWMGASGAPAAPAGRPLPGPPPRPPEPDQGGDVGTMLYPSAAIASNALGEGFPEPPAPAAVAAPAPPPIANPNPLLGAGGAVPAPRQNTFMPAASAAPPVSAAPAASPGATPLLRMPLTGLPVKHPVAGDGYAAGPDGVPVKLTPNELVVTGHRDGSTTVTDKVNGALVASHQGPDITTLQDPKVDPASPEYRGAYQREVARLTTHDAENRARVPDMSAYRPPGGAASSGAATTLGLPKTAGAIEPPQVQAMDQKDVEAIQTGAALRTDLRALRQQIETGKLSLGPLTNLGSEIRNKTGNSSENSRNYASFSANMERMRNDSLRLNAGVQTEGDAQRAWVALVNNINDAGVVGQRLAEIGKLNERAVVLHGQELNRRRTQNGLPPIDVSTLTNQPAAVGGGSGARPASADAVAHLRANPGLADAFDQKYGPGAARRALAQ